MKRFSAVWIAFCLLFGAWALSEGIEKQEDLRGNGIVVIRNKEVREDERQKQAIDYPTFEGEDQALAAYLAEQVTEPFLALRKLGQMAADDAYADGSKDFIRSGYFASMDFSGVLSVEMTVTNRPAGQSATETLFLYRLIDLVEQKELTLYDLFDAAPGDVDQAIREAVFALNQNSDGAVESADLIPSADSYYLKKDALRCIFGAGKINPEAMVIDIPWESLGLLKAPILSREDAGVPMLADERGLVEIPPEEVPLAGPMQAQPQTDFSLPPVQTPTPMPVSGGDVPAVDLLTRGLWKQMGTDGSTYYQFLPDGKLLVVNVEDYTVKEGVLESDSLSGEIILGGDTAFTVKQDGQLTGYVLNRSAEAVSGDEFVTPSPTPVLTPTPIPTPTPTEAPTATPTPSPEPTPTLSPYEVARQEAPSLAALGDASFEKVKTLKVYSAPSEDSYREDQWQVTTDDKVGIYGVENGWVLVSYTIGNGSKGRLGYIEDSTLSEPEKVAQIGLAAVEITLVKDASATDDPLNAKGRIVTLKKGAQVKILAFLGADWAYVETTYKNKPCRLFIPQSSLMSE